MHYTLFFLPHALLFAAAIDAELVTEQWNPSSSSQTAEVDTVGTLSQNPVVLRLARSVISDIASTQKRIVQETVLQASHDSCFLSGYSAATFKDFGNKRLDLQSTKARLLTPGHTDTYVLCWWQCALLFALTPASLSPISLSISPPSLNSLPQQELSDKSDEESIIFCFMVVPSFTMRLWLLNLYKAPHQWRPQSLPWSESTSGLPLS